MGEILGTKKFSVTTAHATTAQATQAAPGAGKRLFVTDIAGSSDKVGAILYIIEDVAGTPVIKFQLQVQSCFAHRFGVPIQIASNKSVTVQVDGTAVCKANIVGNITSH